MTDRDIMQQALDALKQSSTNAPFGADGVVYVEGVKIHKAAIAALNERLAQPEQEPVAYLCENAVGHKYFRWKKPSSTYKPIALYTTPPQRTEQPAPQPEQELVRADEREACAKVCEELFADVPPYSAPDCAAAIRART